MRTRFLWILGLTLVPSLALAAGASPKKKAPRPTPRVVATPEPEPELDEAKAAERDQLLLDARHEFNMAEFLKSRALYRRAVAIDPKSEDARKGLAAAEEECLANAKRQISEAKVYKAANNMNEAALSLELALKYADQPKYKEHQMIRDMQNTLKRETER